MALGFRDDVRDRDSQDLALRPCIDYTWQCFGRFIAARSLNFTLQLQNTSSVSTAVKFLFNFSVSQVESEGSCSLQVGRHATVFMRCHTGEVGPTRASLTHWRGVTYMRLSHSLARWDLYAPHSLTGEVGPTRASLTHSLTHWTAKKCRGP